MSKKSQKQQHAEELAERVIAALNLALDYFPPEEMTDRVKEAAARAGVDWRWIRMGGPFSGFGYHHKREIAWAVNVSVQVSVGFEYGENADRRGVGTGTARVIAAADVGWSSSGSNSPQVALASAALHQETAIKAIQCEVAMLDALGRGRFLAGKPNDYISDVWGIAGNIVGEKAREAHDKTQAELPDEDENAA